MLKVSGLSKRFRGLVAVKDVSFDIKRNEMLALIGPNGAGKTTCFNLIAGALKPSSGSVFLDGEDITGRAPERIAVRGLARTFQIVRPMRGMTVLENVMMGAFAQTSDVALAADIAAKAISRLGLSARANDLARSLTLPDLQMLELARALAASPRALLPAAVMAGV